LGVSVAAYATFSFSATRWALATPQPARRKTAKHVILLFIWFFITFIDAPPRDSRHVFYMV
jgi:hypothetical protein